MAPLSPVYQAPSYQLEINLLAAIFKKLARLRILFSLAQAYSARTAGKYMDETMHK